MSESHRHHCIDYVELSVTDVDRAKRFYGDAFGWTFTDYAPHYVGFSIDGEERGGLRLADEVTPGVGGPLVIVYSDDLQASCAAVEAAGGTVTAPPFDFPGGRRFELRDPCGTPLAVWTKG